MYACVWESRMFVCMSGWLSGVQTLSGFVLSRHTQEGMAVGYQQLPDCQNCVSSLSHPGAVLACCACSVLCACMHCDAQTTAAFEWIKVLSKVKRHAGSLCQHDLPGLRMLPMCDRVKKTVSFRPKSLFRATCTSARAYLQSEKGVRKSVRENR